MKKPKKVYCLFEQSGTYKNEFKKLGIHAEDYDILDDFGQTDHVMDIFGEIDRAYDGKLSLFDEITADDLIFAFFPCTRFEARIPLSFRGEATQQKKWTDLKKLEYSMKLHEELHRLYILISKMFIVALRRNIRMIVENPYTQPHYLTMLYPIKPSVIDTNRMENGDYFKKPTQFWFVNCEPLANVVFEPMEITERYTVDHAHKFTVKGGRKVARSMMHPQYARRFILSYILETKDWR
jgi:hypothetical protein